MRKYGSISRESGFLLDTDPFPGHFLFQFNPLSCCFGTGLVSANGPLLPEIWILLLLFCLQLAPFTIGSRLRILKHSITLTTHSSYWVALKLWIILVNLNAPTNSARAQGSKSLSYCSSRQYQFQCTVGCVLLDISVLEPDNQEMGCPVAVPPIRCQSLLFT